MSFNFTHPAVIVGATAVVGFGIAVAAVSLVNDNDSGPGSKVETTLVESKVHFQVQSLGSDDKPGNTTVFYTPDGVNNVEVGEIGDFWEITLPFNRFASVTFTNGEGTLATCQTHQYAAVQDESTVGPNSWEQCQAK